ncbi:unnamed protein product [Urochloa decumbens]|uniref:Uncharacterized protein n=1 Tax=Urochloa decumbens TaxID=240449 RepID=A0ABC9EPQ5_9POAL
MPGAVPTSWPQLVGQPYFQAYQIITRERPDVHIEEHAEGELVGPGPRDDTRVRVFINYFFATVGRPAPAVG